MAWTAPSGHVYVTGEVVTAATLNTYVANNLTFVGTPPSCRVYRSSAESTANNTPESLTFPTERFKTDASMHSTSSNTGRLIAPLTSKYLIGGLVSWAANATGVRSTSLKLNGGGNYAAAAANNATGSGDTNQSVSTLWEFTAAQYFEVEVNQTSGGNLNVQAGTATSGYLQDAFMTWVGF